MTTTSEHGVVAVIPQDTLDGLAQLGAAGTRSPRSGRSRTSDAFRDLRRAVDARAVAEARVERSVRRLRAADVSWARIAEVLGTTRQAAHQRYGLRL